MTSDQGWRGGRSAKPHSPWWHDSLGGGAQGGRNNILRRVTCPVFVRSEPKQAERHASSLRFSCTTERGGKHRMQSQKVSPS